MFPTPKIENKKDFDENRKAVTENWANKISVLISSN